jgi:hypothetical protein
VLENIALTSAKEATARQLALVLTAECGAGELRAPTTAPERTAQTLAKVTTAAKRATALSALKDAKERIAGESALVNFAVRRALAATARPSASVLTAVLDVMVHTVQRVASGPIAQPAAQGTSVTPQPVEPTRLHRAPQPLQVLEQWTGLLWNSTRSNQVSKMLSARPQRHLRPLRLVLQ